MKEKSPKATGWKVPLIFCAAIIIIAALVRLVLPAKTELPDLSPDLLELARNRKIDLDNPAGRLWKDQIVNAASGFSPRESKDAKLGLIIGSALDQKRFDAACAAVVLLNGQEEKRAALKMIFKKAIENCSDAPWGVFAIHAMGDQKDSIELIEKIEKKWLQCRKSPA